MKVSTIFKTLLLATALVSGASAAMTLDPISSGASVTITGSGAKANGPVELFKNNVSQGWTTASGTGTFSFPGVSVTTGDTFHTTASQVWNFNTDGNKEGWVVASGASADSVAGGVWTITGDGTTNITMNLVNGGNPVLIDTQVTRAFEIRYKITGTYAANTSTVIFDPGSGFVFGPTWLIVPPNGQFQTSIVDMTVTGGATNGFGAATTSIQLAPGANGFGAGAVLEVDYIRVSENIAWEFNNNGDFMNWVPDANTTASVAGGFLSMSNNIAGTNAKISGQFSEINTAFFSVFEAGIDANPTINPNLVDWQYFGNGNAYAAGAHQPGWTAVSGTVVPVTRNLASDPVLFGSALTGFAALNSPAGVFQPLFPLNANEVALVDYIRLSPPSAFGPSAKVTAVSSVENWEMMH